MKKRGRSEKRGTVRTPPPLELWARAESFLALRATWLAVALVALATIRIISIYWTFSYTVDEPAHIGAGMQWIEKHVYKYEPLHPPLTRVMMAVPPKLAGAHGYDRKDMWQEGLDVLSNQGRINYNTLAIARMGMLPFFWTACTITFLLTRWISRSSAAAVIAVFFITMTPSLLANASVATTDIGLTATLLFAVYAACRWIEFPGWRHALVFGAATGLAAIAKLSALAFLPSIAIAAGVLQWIATKPPREPALRAFATAIPRRLPQFAVAVVVGALVIWSAYFFSVGSSKMFPFRVPAPEFFDGISDVLHYNQNGHLTYMTGRTSTVGWSNFYFLALGVKAPVPVLLLGCAGLILLFTQRLYSVRGLVAPAMVIGILGYATFFSQIKIGTRHVLPVFVALGIASGCFGAWILHQKQVWLKYSMVVLCVWMLATSAAAHPDYIAYFNFFAGDRPEEYLVDSDLDWAQDVKRLGERLNAVGAQEVHFHPYAPGNLEQLLGFPRIKHLEPFRPLPGWNAVSITAMKYGYFGGDVRYVGDPGSKFWPETTPGVERVGKGMLLYYKP